MFRKIGIILLVITIVFFACDKNKDIKQNIQQICHNKQFEVIKRLEQEQNTIKLSQLLLNTTNEQEIKQILISLSNTNKQEAASIAINYIFHKSPLVRQTAAFVVGQSSNTIYEEKLIKQYKIETDASVRQKLLVAIAKCASNEGYELITNLKIDKEDYDLYSAQAYSFFYLISKGFNTNQIFEQILQKIEDNSLPHSVKQAYTNIFYLKPQSNFDFKKYFKTITTEIKNTQNVYYATNLIYILMNINTSDNINFLEQTLKSNSDYRIKLAVLDIVGRFNYNSVLNIVLAGLSDPNTQVSEKAADFFLENGNIAHSTKYLELSKKVITWQARTKLLAAALKFSNNKSVIVNLIKSSYSAVDNIYEKAALLNALQWAPGEYRFIKEQTFASDENIIVQAGIAALFHIRTNTNFEYFANLHPQIKTEFDIIFKEAISSNNPILVLYAAKYYLYNLASIQSSANTYFVNQAMSTLKIPADLKVYNLLCELLQKLTNKQCYRNISFNPPNIEFSNICKINNFKIVIKTTKGDIEAQLMADKAPLTVEYFINFIEDKVFQNTYFYNIISGRAIFCGGKRGDGSDFINIPVIKEVNDLNFDEGYLVMNNIDENFQSSNWFITLAPTFEYDNNYTIFAKITYGIDVIHKLEVGDKILNIILK